MINEFFIILNTADTSGYVKIWFVGDYCVNLTSKHEIDQIYEKKTYYMNLFEIPYSESI